MLTKYVDIFCREAQELLAQLQTGLLALEKNPSDKSMLHELLRNAHTLKGSARMVGLADISAITHKMEEQLTEMQDGTRAVETRLIDLLLKGADAVSHLTTALIRGEPPTLDVPVFLARYQNGEYLDEMAGEPSEAPPPESSDTVRADVKTLDALVSLIGEMIINKKRFEAKGERLRELCREAPTEISSSLVELHRELEDDVLYLDFLIQDLQSKAMGLRMVPLKTVTDGFERMVRDLSREQGKEVRLQVSGGAIEMDRMLLENLKPALLHIVTNAVCHGIEPPPERALLGKPEHGTITITARHEGNSVMVGIRDDGRGMSPELIRRVALERRVIDPAEAGLLKDEEVLYLTLRPGFSTSQIITDSAGRGVGMDVVKKNVDRVRGNLTITSEPGYGSEILLQLPLTLSIIEALLINCGGETFAIPSSYVQEIVKIRPSEVTSVAGKEVIKVRGVTTPLCSLASLLGLEALPPSSGRLSALLLKVCDQRIAFTVDSHLGNSEVVVKGLGGQFGTLKYLFGATILGDGNPALILNVPDLFAYSDSTETKSCLPSMVSARPAGKVLVVDDSITTRTMEQSILSGHGYEVEVAISGEEALELALSTQFDLVITDVEMPGMDGFELTRLLRESEQYREIPIIIVSSLSRDEDKRKALHAGAQAYIVKGAFDQGTLLETVDMLIG